jgi:hypothetical protein
MIFHFDLCHCIDKSDLIVSMHNFEIVWNPLLVCNQSIMFMTTTNLFGYVKLELQEEGSCIWKCYKSIRKTNTFWL